MPPAMNGQWGLKTYGRLNAICGLRGTSVYGNIWRMEDIPEQMRKAIRSRNMREVAEGTGINYWWIARFRRGDLTNPTWRQLMRLAEYFGL